ncbi:MAG: efflux RND transporter periplasmic adaptor subunit [Pseudomonadota bacterium]
MKTSHVAIAVLVVLALGAAVAWRVVQADRQRLPESFVSGNGRVEAEQVQIAPKSPGRVDHVLVAEGALVEAGTLLVKMDTQELDASLDRARAEVALAEQSQAEASAIVLQRRSQLRLAEHELERARQLLASQHVPEALFDEKETARDVATAVLAASQARVKTAKSQIAAAQAEMRRIETLIADSTLYAPLPGRVLYRLAEPGEVVNAGAPILTLLSLEDVYMEVFLPAREAGLLPIGAEARIILDALPDYAIPAAVSFVSPEAQFTPKQVETLDEREKLVFRVRVRIPKELIAGRIEHVKTGLRGIAVVRLDDRSEWPQRFEQRIPAELFE